MRIFLLIGGAAIGLGALNVEAQAACNARLEFCSYPTWAANAFSTQGGQKPRYASGYPEADIIGFGYVAPGSIAYGYAPAYGYVRSYGYGPAYGYRGRTDREDWYRRRDRP